MQNEETRDEEDDGLEDEMAAWLFGLIDAFVDDEEEKDALKSQVMDAIDKLKENQ